MYGKSNSMTVGNMYILIKEQNITCMDKQDNNKDMCVLIKDNQKQDMYNI